MGWARCRGHQADSLPTRLTVYEPDRILRAAMTDRPTILITGAAGNLGGLLARHLAGRHRLRLMFHHRRIPADLAVIPEVTTVQADLADPSTLPAAVAGADVVVHFAGVLFAPRPERFLPETSLLIRQPSRLKGTLSWRIAWSS